MPLRRLTHLGLALAAIASGLAFQRLRGRLPFAVADVLGDALWALMIYWGCGVLRPGVHPAVRAAGALVVCWAVEGSQLLHAPTLDAWRATTLGHLILGSGFDPRDLVAYALGVFAGWRLEIAARQRQRQRFVALPPVVRRMKSGVAERASAPGPRGRRRRTRVMRGQ